MNMKRLLSLVAFFATVHASAQQVNPVPDYVFANRMSAGRNTVTDTAAYFSIGPRYGATRGMMPPMVVDTASFSANKRNGLLIFSVQKNKFLYWDSVGVKWAEMAGTGGSAITGSGVAGYMPEFTTTTNLDTTRLYHSAGRFAIGSTTTTNGVFNVYGGQSYLDTSLKVGSQTFLADEGKNEVYVNTTSDAGAYALQVSGNIYNTATAILSATTSILGIGITSPTALASTSGILHLNGLASNSEIHLTNTSTGTTATDGGLLLQFGTRTLLYNLENSSLEFGTNNAERGRINAGGEWIIDASGTDAGDYKLQVVGNLYNTGTAVLSATSGSVGIGTSSPAHKLDVSGLIRSNGGTVFVQNSGTESLGFRFDALTIGYDTTAKVGWITAGGASQRTNLVLQANGGASGGSVGIGTETVNASAKLEVSSTASGFLPPRMTTTQRDAISSPAAGLVIYNTTTSKLQVYTTSWTDLH